MSKRVTLSRQDIIDLRYAIKYGILSDEESIDGACGPLANPDDISEMDTAMIEQWKGNIERLKKLDKRLFTHQV